MADAVLNPTPTLADTVEEFEEKQDDFQAAYNAGGHFKEQMEAIAGSFKTPELQSSKVAEVREMVEIPDSPEIAPEVEGYIEKTEKRPELPKGLADDYVRHVGMTAANTQNVQVTLPLTQDQAQQAIHRKVFESVRWLAIWCLRQMKMVSLKRA